MRQKVIIEPTTDEAVVQLTIAGNELGDILQVDTTIAGSEKVTLRQKNTDGTYSPIVVGGEQMTLDASNTQRVINTINMFQVYKPVTAAAVGVSVLTNK